MSAAFGDFLAAASEHLKAAVAVDGVDGQVAELPAVARDLHHLVAVMSRYCDDLAPCDQVEASARDDLNLWERAAIDASAALRVATGCLRRTAGGTRDQVGAEAPPRARHLAAAATELAAGRDLLHTHFATDPDGLMRDRSEWAAVVTSVPVTRALLNEIGRWSGQLAPFAAWLTGSAAPYPSPGAPEEAVSVPARDELATASLWLHAASVAVRPARDADPLRTADTELLCAIPTASPPQRQLPNPGEESVTELCNGITISASRLRRAVRGNQERGWRSPSLTSGAWQWMAQAAAVTSHLSELALRSLATRAGQLSGLPVSGPQLHDAADLMAGMRAAWHQADQMWDVMITESRPLPAPAMTEASDLVLRMGRLVWDNPHWTPARSCRAPLRRPAALAPEATAVTIILAAAHQATDALAFAAQTDGEAVQAAAGAGRLYVPTRSLPEGYDVPRPFAPAPADRCRALQEVYREALDASIQAVRALDALSVTTGAPSRTLALARAATSAQSRRRGVQGRPDDGRLRDRPPASTPFRHSRAATGQPGPVERAVRERAVSDPAILIRAAAIDDAARRLITEAENTAPVSSSLATSKSSGRTAGDAAQLAAQGFPRDRVVRSPGSQHAQPLKPPVPVLAIRSPAGSGSRYERRRRRHRSATRGSHTILSGIRNSP